MSKEHMIIVKFNGEEDVYKITTPEDISHVMVTNAIWELNEGLNRKEIQEYGKPQHNKYDLFEKIKKLGWGIEDVVTEEVNLWT